LPTSYPAANDSFSEPSSPTSTPLSSSGDGTRNHWQHHRDLGDAVEALEANAALGNHNHDGTGDRPTAKLLQANTHQSPDTDSALTALHHTLGTGTNQAISLPLAKTNLDSRYVRKDASVDETVTGKKTLDTPVIANFTSANHNHLNASQGGYIVNSVRREERSIGLTGISPASNVMYSFSRPISVPINHRLGGLVTVDFGQKADQLQEVAFEVLLGPASATAYDSSTFYSNYYSSAVNRWPGARYLSSDSTGWYWPTEAIRMVMPIPFIFTELPTVRTNYAVFVRMNIGSGAGHPQWTGMKMEAQYEIDIV
jgi:hypothetical protein